MRNFSIFGLALILVRSSFAGLPDASPETLGFDASRLARVEDAVARAVSEKKVPGAVVVVGRRGKIALAKAFGKRAVEPIDEPMTRDTVFDMASLTKPTATATSVMILLERGKIRLSDNIVTHLPELKGNGKDSITIDQLLRHRAGLIPDNPIADYADGPEAAWKKIADSSPQETPGERFLYSDVGFLILGRLVEKVSGQSLDEFARSAIFEPLGMVETGFRPIGGLADEPTPISRIEGPRRRGRACGIVWHRRRPGRLRPDAHRRR
jgi:CubicO group peptidase (beta-lactamase class C family)